MAVRNSSTRALASYRRRWTSSRALLSPCGTRSSGRSSRSASSEESGSAATARTTWLATTSPRLAFSASPCFIAAADICAASATSFANERTAGRFAETILRDEALSGITVESSLTVVKEALGRFSSSKLAFRKEPIHLTVHENLVAAMGRSES